jgi:YidC/Oxa1 family membrane protein insertase
MRTIRIGLLSLMTAALLIAAGGSALAEKRVALVLGVNNYPKLPARMQLKKAVADARTMGETLHSLGFDVDVGIDLDRIGIVTALERLKRRIDPGDMVFVFFAGHGVAFKGSNLLLPSDTPPIDPDAEGLIRALAVAETDIIEAAREKGAGLTILTLDACRDNPIEEFAREQARIQNRPFRSVGMRSAGLEARPTSGVFSIYSAGIGQTALDSLATDRNEPNSVFTRVFAKKLREPGRHLSDVMEDVKEDVARLAATFVDPGTRQPHKQFPAFYNETQGGRVFLAGRTAAATAQPAAVTPPAGRAPTRSEERRDGGKSIALAPRADETRTTIHQNEVSRAEALAAAPRVAIDNPRISGSLSLRGARFDDLSLKPRRAGASGAPFVLLSPAGSASPFYADFGWAGGAHPATPGPDTIWRQDGAGALDMLRPVSLISDLGEGLQFRHTISVDDRFVFTVTVEVLNGTPAPVTLSPFALMMRHRPTNAARTSAHEGIVGVFDGAGLRRLTYQAVAEKKLSEFAVKGGWVGFTENHAAAVVLPDPSAKLHVRFWSYTAPGGVDAFQTDVLLDAQTVLPGARGRASFRLFAGPNERESVAAYAKALGISGFDLPPAPAGAASLQ